MSRTDKLHTQHKTAAGLPEDCYTHPAGADHLGIIKRGELGYYRTDFPGDDRIARRLNERRGISPAQQQAMEIGSMFGWAVPGADPADPINQELNQEADQ